MALLDLANELPRMALLDLANELLRRVADFVHPLDLVKFVLTCTHVHKIAAQRLEHHRAKYSKIKVVAEEFISIH
jgi:hypothetical protein